MDWILRWLSAFALTQCVEMGFYVNAHPGGARARPLRERVAIAFACSAITHPLVWFVVQEAAVEGLSALGLAQGPLSAHWAGVAVAETFAVTVEAAFLALFAVPRALLWSLAANATSVLFGFFCYLYLAW